VWYQVLSGVRDGALILLALEGFVLCIVPLLVLYYITRGLRQLMPRVVPAMRRAHEAVRSVQSYVERAMSAICAPFIWLARVSAQVRKGWEMLCHRLRIGRA
jgi:hypothetical protein